MAVKPGRVIGSLESSRDPAYDAAFPSLGASVVRRQKADKQRKKITPTPVAAAQVDNTFLLAQPSEQSDRSFRRPAKSLEVDLRFLLREKRGQGKVDQNGTIKEPLLDGGVTRDKAAASEGSKAWGYEEQGGSNVEVSEAYRSTGKDFDKGAKQPQSESAALPDPSPTKESLLHTPPAGKAFIELPMASAKRQLFGANASSPAKLPEVPAKLSAERQRAAERQGAQLKDGTVASLLRDLQLIVDLLTAQPTSCGLEHLEDSNTNFEDDTLNRSQQAAGNERGGADSVGATGRGPSEGSPTTDTSLGESNSLPVLQIKQREQEEGVVAKVKLKPKVSVDQSVAVDFPDRSDSSPHGKASSMDKGPVNQASNDAETPGASVRRGLLAFCCGDMAAAYACSVLEHSLPLILHCGEPVLVALLQEPAVIRHSPSLTRALQDALTAHQSSSLRGLGTPQKHGSVKSSGPLAALPFDEEQDSRNIPFFKTQEGQRLYTNREECRDIFYRIIRDAASTSTGFTSESQFQSLKQVRRPTIGTSSGFFGRPSFPRPERPLDFPARVAQFLAHLQSDNYPWLAKLLVQQIIQVASTGEIDPEVRNLAREDTAKLQRLHSRLLGSGSVSTRLAAGGTPTRESPGSRLRSLSGTSPVVVGGVLKSSPRPEERKIGSEEAGRKDLGVLKTSAQLQVEERKQTEGASTEGRRQTVRRTLEGLFQGTERAKDETLAVASSTLLAASNGRSRTDPIPSLEAPLQRDASLRKGLSLVVTKQSDPLAEDGIFGGLFSRSLSPYVRFLQTADSHRLHVLLVTCICDSIGTLSQTTPGTIFSSSSFSERVITLQNLARFLGFLLFAPISDEPSLPESKLPVYAWSGELPLSLVGALQDAVKNGSSVLTLPWVLELLGMMRVCPPARSAPTFVQAVAAVERLRAMPALLPSDPSFGLPNMCLVAALDGFFREEPTLFAKPLLNPEPPSASWPPRDSLDSLGGLIDSRYIQNCCPLLEELALTLLEAAERRRSDGADGANPPDRRSRPIRKITPTAPPQKVKMGGLPADVLAALPSEDLVLVRPPPKDPLKARLESVFFEQQPHLRRLVDFVVDAVSANSALAAQLATCPAALEQARALLREEKDVREAISEGRFDVLVEQAISDACRRAFPPAIAYARKHSHERICEALSALARPNIAPPILGTAAAVAAQASAVGTVKILLINVPKEIRKSVLEDAEKVKKKAVAAMRQPVRPSSEQERTEELLEPV